MAEYEPPEWRACHGSDMTARTVPSEPPAAVTHAPQHGVIPHDLSATVRSSRDDLRRALADRDRWRLLFAALVARTAGVATDSSTTGGRVALGWAEIERARGLVLAEWPALEATYEFTLWSPEGAP